MFLFMVPILWLHMKNVLFSSDIEIHCRWEALVMLSLVYPVLSKS